MNRCPWCLINDLEIQYHDEEWGVPVHDDQKQFEYLMMEVMQCGLSWDTVLKSGRSSVPASTGLTLTRSPLIPKRILSAS